MAHDLSNKLIGVGPDLNSVARFSAPVRYIGRIGPPTATPSARLEAIDPVHTAAMYQARARDAARDAQFERRAGREHSAVIFDRMASDDIARARSILEAAASSEDDDAT